MSGAAPNLGQGWVWLQLFLRVFLLLMSLLIYGITGISNRSTHFQREESGSLSSVPSLEESGSLSWMITELGFEFWGRKLWRPQF